MDFDYFYGRDSESFRFIRLPVVLIEDEIYKDLSIEAKVLYSMYLSRSTLSYKNNWIDESGRVYIYFTVEETARQLGCGVKKAVKLIKDLEEIGLIKKKRTGQGNPTKIYVKDFMSVFRNGNPRPVKKENQDLSKGQFKNGDFDNSRMVKKKSLDLSKRQTNYIENNKIDKSYIDFSKEDRKGTFLNVTLSDEEERLLEEKIPNLNDYIERLSAYMQSTGKIYKDHASTIMSWYLKDKKEGKLKGEKTYTGDPSDYESEWNLNN
ncbi:replication initiator protein A [Clostridium algidicarnis]|uniref:replication initiator protein A n=1 Tax=Clostridium algidicarnis TaxID=37659 RepID=UPI001C0B9233|nr:replication initiator protein A [Clostridium algidicarnis]MBU3194706.1 replication initiator protein A [Clostridium algidicarnis]MBU3207968.1 replication initiator protein A [Clostridium algidicarnis]